MSCEDGGVHETGEDHDVITDMARVVMGWLDSSLVSTLVAVVLGSQSLITSPINLTSPVCGGGKSRQRPLG